MEIKNLWNMEIDNDMMIGMEEAVRDIGEMTDEVYPNDHEETSEAIITQIPYILQELRGNVRGKTILDLGSGSTFGGYKPWLCRILYHMGANPIAVDLGKFRNEPFIAYSADLSQPNALRMIPDNSVDLANAKMFFTCSDLRSMRPNAYLREQLRPQLERVLKQDASFIYAA
jgi:hypothetical protein